MPVEWVFDSEGVHVCADCWDDEMREKWPRMPEGYDTFDSGVYCESCGRYPGNCAPDWMQERAKDAVVAAARALGTPDVAAALADLDRLKRQWVPAT